MKIQCPKCKEEFEIQAISIIPKSDIIYLECEFKSELLDAGLVGKLIQNMEGIQRQIGKDLGFKVSVFVTSIEYKPPKIKIGFITTQMKNKETP